MIKRDGTHTWPIGSKYVGACTRMVKSKEQRLGLVVASMLEHSRMIKSTGKEHSLGPMLTSMLEHGRMIKITGKEHTLMPVVKSMLGTCSFVHLFLFLIFLPVG